jgi:hypothetical protein
LFSKPEYRDRWANNHAARCFHYETGRVTFRKTFCGPGDWRYPTGGVMPKVQP